MLLLAVKEGFKVLRDRVVCWRGKFSKAGKFTGDCSLVHRFGNNNKEGARGRSPCTSLRSSVVPLFDTVVLWSSLGPDIYFLASCFLFKKQEARKF